MSVYASVRLRLENTAHDTHHIKINCATNTTERTNYTRTLHVHRHHYGATSNDTWHDKPSCHNDTWHDKPSCHNDTWHDKPSCDSCIVSTAQDMVQHHPAAYSRKPRLRHRLFGYEFTDSTRLFGQTIVYDFPGVAERRLITSIRHNPVAFR